MDSEISLIDPASGPTNYWKLGSGVLSLLLILGIVCIAVLAFYLDKEKKKIPQIKTGTII